MPEKKEKKKKKIKKRKKEKKKKKIFFCECPFCELFCSHYVGSRVVKEYVNGINN